MQPRTILAIQHDAGTRIGVTYEPGNPGTPQSNGRGLVVSVYRNSDPAERAPQRFRFWNPAGVTAWFTNWSPKNLDGWRYAYHHSGLTVADFVRPGGNIADVVVEAPYKEVPYHSQRDNKRAPSGTCNVTSYAMLFDFYRVPTIEHEYAQAEDNLEYYMSARGLERTNHSDLVTMARAHGLGANFRTGIGLKDIRADLRGGFPVIVSGQFTKSGHIVCIIGMKGVDFVVHDPFGDYNSGYRDHNGAARIYSEETMQNVLIDKRAGRSPIWAHFVRPPGK